MRFLLPFILVGFASSAHAAFSQANCSGTKDFIQIFLEDGVGCGTVEKIQRELTDIQVFVGEEPPLILFVQSRSYNSFGTYGRTIILNDQQLAWGTLRPQSQTVEIWAHELGHTFFSTWLARDFAPIGGFRDYMIANAKIQAEARDPSLDTSKSLASIWNADLGKARDIQVPYNELFADLIGTLYGESADAMAKAMISPEMPGSEKAKTAYYSFQGTYDLSKWNEAEVHYFFAPVRALIGERFLKFPMKSEQKNFVVQKVYQACLSEIKKNWLAGKSLPPPAEANKSLMRTLGQSD